MTFDSLTFLLFLLVVLALHQLPTSWTAKKCSLLFASYLFYAAWNPPFVVLLAVSTVIDWYLAAAIARSRSHAARRALVTASLAVNLGLLGFFKYGTFLLENFVALMAAVGINFEPARPDIILPVGISFYTFQTLSYTLDVYRGRLRPSHSFLDYSLFVSFFPQLVAGPIVRASQFLPQCARPRGVTANQLGWGLALLAIGLFEKTILADSLLAPVADKVYAAPHEAGFLAAWIGTLAFSAQIFFDFSGYSTCAIGVAMCLGFSLPDNFRFPYAAIGFSDFWRRWHISLSTWLRDYLYVSLGGNREGTTRTILNVMITMLIGGLWHGASWLFVLWGGLHGLLLAIERPFRDRLERARAPVTLRAAGALLTFLVVSLAWVLFRAQTLQGAMDLLGSMLLGGDGSLALTTAESASVLLIVALLLAGQWAMRDTTLEEVIERIPASGRVLMLASILVALAVTPGGNRAFIYFQF